VFEPNRPQGTIFRFTLPAEASAEAIVEATETA
jgi:hypothetical protein